MRSSDDSGAYHVGGWEPSRGCDPPLVALKFQPEFVVKDLQISVAAAHHRFGHDRSDFLRHDADIGSLAVDKSEAIESNSIVQVAEQDDLALQRNIGSPAAATATATTAAPSAAAMGGDVRRSSAAAKALGATIGMCAGSMS
jgi:hypothetical protein